MEKITEAAVAHRRALNQALIHSTRVPARAVQEPFVFVRALRSALRMSQAQLARRAGVPRAHIARLETGTIDARLSTLRRLFDAMFCGLIVLPLARERPSEAVARRRLEPGRRWRLWDDELAEGKSGGPRRRWGRARRQLFLEAAISRRRARRADT